MIGVIQIATTAGRKEDAQRIAQGLLERRLAACVQISGPLESSYWWEGKIERSEEWLCVIKTVREIYSQVEEAIRELHPYEEPEILAVEAVAGSGGYLKWVADAVQPPPG